MTWRWGDFTVKPQDDSTFTLPGTDAECAKTCSKLLSSEEHAALTEHIEKNYFIHRQ